MDGAFPTQYEGPESSPGYLLWWHFARWHHRIHRTLAPLGLTHLQFVLLATLCWAHRQGQKPTQVALARMAGTDAMSTSKALRLLEKKQLIQRLSNPQDARAHMLSPTDTGYSLLYQAMPLVEQADEAYFSPLDAAQRQAFLRSLTALQAAASDDLS